MVIQIEMLPTESTHVIIGFKPLQNVTRLRMEPRNSMLKICWHRWAAAGLEELQTSQPSAPVTCQPEPA